MKYLSITLVIITIAAVLILIAKPGTKLACTEFGHLNSMVTNSNSIEVELKSDKGITIVWASSNTSEPLIIWQNGKSMSSIPNLYGPNTIKVMSDGKEIASKIHLKTNWWHAHQYRIIETSNGVLIEVVGCNGS